MQDRVARNSSVGFCELWPALAMVAKTLSESTDTSSSTVDVTVFVRAQIVGNCTAVNHRTPKCIAYIDAMIQLEKLRAENA